MNISVFGLGYVGAVSCGCLAKLGHQVIGVDVAQDKVDLINSGNSPIIEPDLPEMLSEAVAEGKLSATTDTSAAIAASSVALVCVGTPSAPSGAVDDKYVTNVCNEIGQSVRQSNRDTPFTVMVRSTCLPPVHTKLQKVLAESSGKRLGTGISYVCHPEFLRESVAVWDFFNPPKIVFGCSDDAARTACETLYPNIKAPTVYVEPEVAAMVKYADNCFHAVKVTFGNEIGMMCESFGVDAREVMSIFCQDTKLNISPKYLLPGNAFGGSCLPKDLRAILDAARQNAVSLPMLSGSSQSNEVQIQRLVALVSEPARQAVGVIGLAFKEGTDDVRESPMVAIVEQLRGKGHPVKIYDDHLSIANLVGGNRSFALERIPHLSELLSDDLQSVIDDSDLVVVSHRLAPEIWKQVTWKANQRVIDLVHEPALKTAPRYEGLYW